MLRALLLASTAIAAVLHPAAILAQSAVPSVQLELSGSPDALGAELGLFTPVDIGPGTIVYGTAHGGALPGNGTFYGSLGAGIRARLSEDWVLGGLAHIDALRTGRDNVYQRLAAGLELLSRDYEFRLEGDVPLGTSAFDEDDLTTVGIENEAIAIRQGYEVALYGVHAEAGLRLPVFDDDSGQSLKLFGEAFARYGEHVGTVYGLGARAELQLVEFEQWPGASLTLGGGLRHDTTGATTASAFLRFSAPLGGSSSSGPDARDPLYLPPAYDPRIATLAGAYGAPESASYLDGRDTGVARQIDAGSGDAAAINALIADAGENAVLLVNGEIHVDAALQLAMGQTLLGGQNGLTVVAGNSGKQYTLYNSGERGHIVAVPSMGIMSTFALLADAPRAVVELADYTTVAALDITGGDFGISGEGLSGITIADVNIAETTSHGIRLVDVDGATIRDVGYVSTLGCDGCPSMSYSNVYDTVTQAALYGVGLRNATIEGFESDGAAWGLVLAGLHDGTDITAAASGITVSDVTIRNSSEEAMLFYVAEDIDVSDFLIDNAGRPVSQVHDSVVFMSSSDITLRNGTARGGVNGLMFVDPEPLPLSNGNITVANVTIEDTYRAGIFLNPTNGVTFSNVDIVRPAHESWATAIFLYGGWTSSEAISNVIFDGVTVTDVVDPGSSGINLLGYLTNLSGDITITGAGTVCNDWGATISGSDSLLINGSPITSAC